jgi:hypothetical protein
LILTDRPNPRVLHSVLHPLRQQRAISVIRDPWQSLPGMCGGGIGFRKSRPRRDFGYYTGGKVKYCSVGSDSFEAVLSDPLDLTLTERATFQKTEVKPDSIKMVRPGATFYWFLGLEDSSDGQRRRASVIWMKRGGQITQDKYLAEWKKVQELWGSIEWSEPKTATGS